MPERPESSSGLAPIAIVCIVFVRTRHEHGVHCLIQAHRGAPLYLLIFQMPFITRHGVDGVVGVDHEAD
jgi:hypothetical protein